MAANKRQMFWTEQKYVLLCRALMIVRPYQYNIWSKESSTGWTKITETLIAKDHFNLLLVKRENSRKGNTTKRQVLTLKRRKSMVFLMGICQENANQPEAKRAADQQKKEVYKTAMATLGEKLY